MNDSGRNERKKWMTIISPEAKISIIKNNSVIFYLSILNAFLLKVKRINVGHHI